MTPINIESLPERVIQLIVQNALSDPSIIRKTNSGKRIQILSPGRINQFAGPDFLEIALMLDGAIVLGDSEFHRKSSEWENHKHSEDHNYDNVVLHIVIDDNSRVNHDFEILQIPESELRLSYQRIRDKTNNTQNSETLEDLQHFALMRILRKTGDAKKKINDLGLISALSTLTGEHLQKYNNSRKRSVYTEYDLISISENILNSPMARFLIELNNLESTLIPDKMLELLKTKISTEGAHLRREIILNCILPLALAVSEEQSRINLFLWYWSTPALHSYGVLSRKFKDLPQNFLWQQQGMLEYIKEYGAKKNLIKESMGNYGFGELLGFYYVGKTPYKEE